MGADCFSSSTFSNVPKPIGVEAEDIQDYKDKLFHEIAKQIADTLARKNHDYGDSFHKVYSKFGDLSTFIRLQDKMGRLESLISGKDMKVKDEPLVDVYKDIAGYCILTLVSMYRLREETEQR